MRYLLAVVMVLVFAVGAFGQTITYLGQYAPGEYVSFPVLRHLDSTSGTSPNLRGNFRYPITDTIIVQCMRASSSRTVTYQASAVTFPWSLTNCTLDTTKYTFVGAVVDTTVWLRYLVSTLNNGTTTGCLTCNVTFDMRTGRRRSQAFTIQVMPDTVDRKLSRSLLASGSGTSYLKVDSIAASKIRVTTPANATYPAVLFAGDTAAGLRITTTTGPAFHLKPTTGIGFSITPTTGTGIDITPSSTGIGFRINGSDTGLVVATSGSGKPAVAFRNTHATGAAGSNGLYVSSINREAGKFAATSSSSTAAHGLMITSASSGGIGFYIQNSNGGSSVYSDAAAYTGEGFPVGYLYDGSVRALSIATDGINSTNLAGTAAAEIRDSILNRLNDSVWMSKKGFGAVKGIVTGGGSDSGCYSASFTAASGTYTNRYLVQCFYGTGANQMAIVSRQTLNTGDTIRWLPKFGTPVATNDSIRLIPLGSLFYAGPARLVNDSNIMLATDNPTLASSQTFNNTGTWTGNLTGSVGSVTGAVGSVTGNVGGNVTGSVGSVTADVGITQTGADKVWSSATRILTAGTNIVLAKGTGVTGFNDITAADVWAAATRTLTAVPTGGALEASVTKVRDSLTILASDARLKKIDSISNLIALCQVIKAAVDTSIAAAGWKSTSSSTQGFSTDTDTLHIWWGPTELLKTLFWHVGKGPGSVEIDSTRVVWLP